MSALRASPSPSNTYPSPSPFPSPSNTMAKITSVFRNSMYNHNMTAEEMNMAMGDLNSSSILSISEEDILTIFTTLSMFAAVIFVVWVIMGIISSYSNKDKLNIAKPIKWISNKYSEMTTKEILPTIRLKKAKQSPFVSSAPISPTLPSCFRLDGAEKGQNIMFRFRGPVNSRIESSDTTNTDNETRITIVAVVENNHRSSPVLMA